MSGMLASTSVLRIRPCLG
ncbi:hypothetical protein F383_30579 [Gossypium arboreum]|uniref:Uncharacterized protein n=1 Tax=Gossypium arboreum TaxID=29729 RepID=A0A0B0PI18_GOSAR|nr:hypothetical protein F383_30579 [Gossypium arboreum]